MTQLNIEIVQGKLFKLNANIRFVEEILKATDEELLNGDDKSKYTALEHILQLSIQIILDVGSQILAETFADNPATYADVIISLGEKGVISKKFAKENEEMAKFRNKLVHDYDTIDSEKVLEYARSAPEVFREFGRAFSIHLK